MHEGVLRLASDLNGPERDRWLRVLRACYDASGHENEPFARAWLHGLDGTVFNLRLLERYGLLTKVATSRRGHRAYWKFINREGVETALRTFGYL